MTKCCSGRVASSPHPCLCSALLWVWQHIPLCYPSLPPPEEQEGHRPPVWTPQNRSWWGGMGDVKPENTANICVHLGPNLSSTESAQNNFHWLQEPSDQTVWVFAPMALFTILVGLQGNRRVLSSENQVLVQACWKYIQEVKSGFRESEEDYSAKLTTLNWEEFHPNSMAWHRAEGSSWSAPSPSDDAKGEGWLLSPRVWWAGCAPGSSPLLWCNQEDAGGPAQAHHVTAGTWFRVSETRVHNATGTACQWQWWPWQQWSCPSLPAAWVTVLSLLHQDTRALSSGGGSWHHSLEINGELLASDSWK